MEDNSGPVVVARTWTEGEASVIKSLLESYEIPCHYQSELPNRLYPVPAEGMGPIRIFYYWLDLNKATTANQNLGL
jgi:hypothetical protein